MSNKVSKGLTAGMIDRQIYMQVSPVKSAELTDE